MRRDRCTLSRQKIDHILDPYAHERIDFIDIRPIIIERAIAPDKMNLLQFVVALVRTALTHSPAGAHMNQLCRIHDDPGFFLDLAIRV